MTSTYESLVDQAVREGVTISDQGEQEVVASVKASLVSQYGDLVTDAIVDWYLVSLVDDTYDIAEVFAPDGTMVALTEVRCQAE